MDFSQFPFNILHRGKIDKRLMRAVEVILNKLSCYPTLCVRGQIHCFKVISWSRSWLTLGQSTIDIASFWQQ